MVLALLLASQIALGLVFAVAVIGKLRRYSSFARAVRDYRVLPERAATPVAYLILAAEAGVACALLLGRRSHLGAVGAGVLLLFFLGAVLINIRRNRKVPCGCFGSETETISWRSVYRLGLLLMLWAWLMSATAGLGVEGGGIGALSSQSSETAAAALGLCAFELVFGIWAMNGREVGAVLIDVLRASRSQELEAYREA